jgi:Skp family chaperone for outer membrane proteins
MTDSLNHRKGAFTMTIRFQPRGLRMIVAAAIMAGLTAARPAVAADPGANTIAIASVQKIFDSIHELADIRGQLDLDRKALADTDTQKQNEINSIQQSLSYLKSDSSQYAEQQNKLMKAKIEYDDWRREAQLDLERKAKTEMKQVFQEVQDAIAQVAQKDGISLVIDDARPQIPDNLENMTLEELQARISQRTILYSDQSRDISGEVITLMDKNYAAKNAAPH